MTDNEIIKALECCANATHKDCKNCPLFVVNGCVKTMSSNALDLINRQHAENINLKVHLEQLKSRYDNARTEIERLKGISVSPSKDPMDFCGVLCDYAEELIDKAKAEAYKEFAERLKENAHTQPIFDTYCGNKYMGDVSKIYVVDIDNLVKEYEKGR